MKSTNSVVVFVLCSTFVVWSASSFSLVTKPLFRSKAFASLFASINTQQEEVVEDENDDDDSTSFQNLGLGSEALEAVDAQEGWLEPTPIQQLAIPRLLTANDNSFWCEAPTGSGKTAAFVLPLLQRLLQDRKRTGWIENDPAIASLILCPTRELATQIGHVVTELSSYMMKCNIMVITGGTRREQQLLQLADWAQRGEAVDVVVATPGRLLDVLTRYKGSEDATDAAFESRIVKAMEETSKNGLSLEQIQLLKLDRQDDEGRSKLSNLLEDLQYIILDEADRLLSRAFEDDINAVLDLLKPENREGEVVKTWLFSATFPKLIEPRVDAVLKRLGHTTTTRISCANIDRVTDGDEVSATLEKRMERMKQKDAAPERNSLTKVGPASTIKLRSIRLDKRDRTQALKYLLQKHEEEWSKGGVLVFVATRYAAEHVSRKLCRAGIRSAEVHGKLDQDARARRLEDLQSGKIHVLLTTDLTSRGIDLKDLSAVVNYDLPRSTADFVHRVGRTGRAGRSGTAITFVTPATETQMDLIEKRHVPEPTPREILSGFEVDEDKWRVQAESARMRTPGAGISDKSLAFDRMHGGIKGKRKSKKDRLREQAAKETPNLTTEEL